MNKFLNVVIYQHFLMLGNLPNTMGSYLKFYAWQILPSNPEVIQKAFENACCFTHVLCAAHVRSHFLCRLVVTLHWLQQHFLRPMSMDVEEPELPYLWHLPFIWEPVWEQKAHIMETEDIYQLHNTLWHINAHHGVQSLSFWILGPNIEPFFDLCFFFSALQCTVKSKM